MFNPCKSLPKRNGRLSRHRILRDASSGNGIAFAMLGADAGTPPLLLASAIRNPAFLTEYAVEKQARR